MNNHEEVERILGLTVAYALPLEDNMDKEDEEEILGEDKFQMIMEEAILEGTPIFPPIFETRQDLDLWLPIGLIMTKELLDKEKI